MTALLGLAFILFVGVVGYGAGRVHARSLGVRAQAKPAVCEGCQHNYSYHDPRTGACHAAGARQKVYVNGAFRHYEPGPACTCRRYNGPIPVDMLAALAGVPTVTLPQTPTTATLPATAPEPEPAPVATSANTATQTSAEGGASSAAHAPPTEEEPAK